MDGGTDGSSYGDAWTHLKRVMDWYFERDAKVSFSRLNQVTSPELMKRTPSKDESITSRLVSGRLALDTAKKQSSYSYGHTEDT